MKNVMIVIAFTFGMIAGAQVSMDLPAVSKIMIDDNAIVEIKYAPTSRIQFSGTQQEFINRVATDSGVLMIKDNQSGKKIRARIYTANLSAIQISGNADVTVEGFNTINQLSVSIKENSKLDMGNIKINNLLIDQEKSSTVIAPGAKSTQLIMDGALIDTY